MPHNWKDDPRVRSMNPEKIQFLSDFADRIRQTPKQKLMEQFLAVTMEANQKGISFSDQETDLLAELLVKEMPPADRGRLDMLRMLAKKLAR